MRDALLIGEYDWANTGFRFSRCMRLMGMDVLMIKSHHHPFMYPEQAIVHPEFMGLEGELPSIADLIDSSKVIHFIGSVAINTPTIIGKKYVVQHGGTIYRENHAEINQHFNGFCDAAIIQCPDLLNLGAKNEMLIYYPVDTELIQPVYRGQSDVVLIGHFPSNPAVKGTKQIVEIIKELEADDLVKDKFKYIGTRDSDNPVSWWDNIRRMGTCDILIETLQSKLAGRNYGEWGNTALEAAALGKVVITNSIHQEHYHNEYGDCALEIANTREELKETLKKWILVSDLIRLEKRKQTRDWAHKKHGMRATGERIMEKVYRGLLC